MSIKDDGFRVYLDYGSAITYEWEKCYTEGFINQEVYDICKQIQKQLDLKPF